MFVYFPCSPLSPCTHSCLTDRATHIVVIFIFLQPAEGFYFPSKGNLLKQLLLSEQREVQKAFRFRPARDRGHTDIYTECK